MNLPRGYRAKNFVADPHNRANHLYHPKTDEVFHVDADTYNAIVKPDPAAPEDENSLARDEVETDAETGLTLRVEASAVGEGAEEDEEPGDSLVHDLVELKAMAEGLGLELAEDATPKEIQAAVYAAVGGAK